MRSPRQADRSGVGTKRSARTVWAQPLIELHRRLGSASGALQFVRTPAVWGRLRRRLGVLAERPDMMSGMGGIGWRGVRRQVASVVAGLVGFTRRLEPAASVEAGQRMAGPEAGVVPARNRLFTGRVELLELVGRELAEGPVVVTAPHGLGGVGKTQLAVEYAHRHAGDYTLIWWVDAEQTELLAEKVAALAGPLSLPRDGAVMETASAVLAALAHREQWLVVFDNAEDPAAVCRWLPSGPGHVLITSRNPVWEALAATVEVDPLPRAESVVLLTAPLPGLDPAVADALAAELGDLPLALTQAAGYLAHTRVDPAVYLDRFRARRRDFLGKGDDQLDAGRIDTCWSLSLERLQVESPAAVDLLERCALLAPEPIPLSLLANTTRRRRWQRRPAQQPPLGGDDSLDEALAAAGAYSLLHRDSDSVIIHRLVQAAIAGQLTPLRRKELIDTTAQLLSATTPTNMGDPTSWPAWTALGPHILHVYDRLDTADDSHHLRRAADLFCFHLHTRGDHTAAHALATRLHHEAHQQLGPDHPDTLNTATTLATALAARGEYQAARELAEDTLARRRRILGPDHPHTLASANTLANRLAVLGEAQTARQLAEDTWTRMRQTLGPNHPDTLAAASNLAIQLAMRGEAQAARQLAEDTLDHRRQVLGEDHPNTRRSEQVLRRVVRESANGQTGTAPLPPPSCDDPGGRERIGG